MARPLAMIAALGENRAISIDSRLPWRLLVDLKHFKAMILGKSVITGRKTRDLPGRPLPGRLNLVVSRQAGLALEGAEVFASLDAALARAEAWVRTGDADELILIGGTQFYAGALSRAARSYLIRVSLAPEGDAFFLEIDGTAWRLVSSIEHAVANDAPVYAFEVWERR